MSLMTALEKAGLVAKTAKTTAASAPEIDEKELESLLASMPNKKPAVKKTVASISAVPTTYPPVQIAATQAEEELPFEAIYERSGVPASVYTIEKLSKVLDGLGQMDVGTRRTVISALDAADDSWHISDPLNDAQAKIAALADSKARLTLAVSESEKEAAAELKSQDSYLTEAVKELQSQILELNKKLQEETQAVAQSKAEIQGKLAQKKNGCSQRQAELDGEIGRFQKLVLMFGGK